ncbi:MAG: EpsD family peptidyl-prolyl cis-trans isomerase [Aquabacterium sp.]
MQTRLSAFARSRSMRLMALLPVVVAASLAAGCGDKSKPEGKASQAAARVDSTEITVHQINQVLERQQGLKPEQAEAASRQVLEGLIDQQLAVAKAEEQKLDRDPQVVQMLDAMRRNVLARTYLEKAAAAAVGAPTAEDVRKYFDEKPALFSQRKVYAIQEFTVPVTPDVAKPLIDKLKETKGQQAFVDVLKNSGVKFTANQVTQAAEGLPLAIVDKLAQVSDGEALYVTAPDGFKAMLVVASKLQPVTFEQAKPAIEQFLTAERRREFVKNEVKNLRAAAKVEYIGKFAEKPASGAAAAAPASAEVAPPVADAAASAAPGGLDANALNKGLSGLK